MILDQIPSFFGFLFGRKGRGTVSPSNLQWFNRGRGSWDIRNRKFLPKKVVCSTNPPRNFWDFGSYSFNPSILLKGSQLP